MRTIAALIGLLLACPALVADKLAYFSDGGLRIEDPAGSAPKQIPLAGGPGAFLAWSPDGTRLAFVTDPIMRRIDNAYQIGTARVFDSVGREILKLPLPAYSPIADASSGTRGYSNGTWGLYWIAPSIIAYETHISPSTNELRLYDLDQKKHVKAYLIGGDFSVSPDRRSIAYVGWGPRVEGDYIMVNDTLVFRSEQKDDQVTSDLLWSPDGKRVAFLLRREALPVPTQLFVVSTDGKFKSRPQPVTDGPLVWLDDTRVCIVDGQQVVIYDLGTNRTTRQPIEAVRQKYARFRDREQGKTLKAKPGVQGVALWRGEQ